VKAVTVKDGELTVEEQPNPEPGAGELLVRVRAAGLNGADMMQRRGLYPAPPGWPQDIPGMELAGEVVALGPGARRFKEGDRVMAVVGGGAQAELAKMHEREAMLVPENLSWPEAGGAPEILLTAHDALFTQCRLQMGERVLIHAAGSGVGTAASQLVNAAGAIAYGTSRTAEKLARAKEFGLTESVVVANDSSEFAEAVKRWTNDAGVDVILDLVGAAYLKANLDSLVLKGRLIFVGTTSGAKAEIDYSVAMHKRLRIMGTSLRTRSIEEKGTATRLFAQHVVPMFASGAVRPVIDSVFPINEVRAAHQRIESNESFGKVVLTID